MDTVNKAWLQYRLDSQAAMHAKDKDAAHLKAEETYHKSLQSIEDQYRNIIEEVKNDPL